VLICASIGPPALLRERYSAGFSYGDNSIHQNMEFAVPTDEADRGTDCRRHDYVHNSRIDLGPRLFRDDEDPRTATGHAAECAGR
jgi:hypothetical protein